MSTSDSESEGSGTVAVRPDALTAALHADAMELVVPGTLVGRYRIEASIGSGGMGLVLRAHDPELDRDVALKRIRSDRASATAQHRLRFGSRTTRGIPTCCRPRPTPGGRCSSKGGSRRR